MQVMLDIKESAGQNTARKLDKYSYADSLLMKGTCPAVTADFDQCTKGVYWEVLIAVTGMKVPMCGGHKNCALDIHHGS